LATLRVIPVPDQLLEACVPDSISVIIDVLRATSSMAQALSAGATSIIPAKDTEEALVLKERFPDALLGGEIGGDKIPGFDLGNSPREYKPEIVSGKTIIMTTSNGTKAIRAAKERGFAEVFLCSFLNLRATGKALRDLIDLSTRSGNMNTGSVDPGTVPFSVSIVCSGSHGEFSPEDFACAGSLVEDLLAEGPLSLQRRGLSPDESAQEAMNFFRRYRGEVLKILEDSPHGRYLRERGYAEDLLYCARLNSLGVVPVLRGEGVIGEIGNLRPGITPERETGKARE